MIFYLYFGVVAVAVVYAFRFGGWPEKFGAAVALSGSLLSSLVVLLAADGLFDVHLGLLAADLVVFAALLWLALTTNRFWPLWVSGFHLTTVITHFAASIDSSVVPDAYLTGQALWAYPMLMALLLGSERCRRLRAEASASAYRF